MRFTIEYDLRKDLRYKQGKSEGESKGWLKIAKRLIRKRDPISVLNEATTRKRKAI